jgi:EmrB/QacA subfamily drug resistance transporter
MTADEAVAIKPEHVDEPTVSPRTWMSLAVILIAAFMELLDVTVVTVALPAVQYDLHATYANVQWILAGYQLSFAVGLITGGRLGDIFGRRRMFLYGVVAFVLASLLCGTAQTGGWLIAARLLQGLTAALMYPQTFSIIQVSFPPQKRAAAFGLLGATIGISGVAGPLLGGLLVDWDLFGWGWRTIFMINVPVGIFALITAWLLLDESRAPDRPKIDLVGMAIVTLGLGALLFGLIQGRDANWAWWVWALMLGSLPVLLLFVLHQRARQAAGSSPLLDLRMFSGSRFGTGMLIVLVFFSGVSALFFVYAVYLQAGFGFTPMHAGLAFLPIAGASMLGAGAGIPLSQKIGKYIIQIGACLLVVGVLWLMSIVGSHHGPIGIGTLVPAELVLGFGLGLSVSTINDITLAEARGPSAGSATGAQQSAGQIGNAIGVAILGTIFFGLLAGQADTSARDVVPQLRRDLAAVSVAPDRIDGMVSGFEDCLHDRAHAKDYTALPASCDRLIKQVPTDQRAKVLPVFLDDMQAALRSDFAGSLRTSLWYEVVVFGLVILLLFFLPRRKGGHSMTEVDAR